MSNKIYFNTPGRFSVKRSMVNVTTRLHHTIARKHAIKTAKKLLLTPARLKAKNPDPQNLIRGKVACEEGPLATYSLGEGPVWLITHGWSGSTSQFFPLMEHIAAQGFTALAFDYAGHGESGGRYGHLPAFVNAMDAMADSVDNIAGIVAHSMGSAAVLESKHRNLKDKPLLLVAPVVNYLDNLMLMIQRSGFSIKLFNEVISEVESQYQYPLQSIDPQKRLIERQAPTMIVHDSEDKFANHSISVEMSEQSQWVDLISVQGYGHNRIMKADETMQAFERLVEKSLLK
ncbi:MULTISPECIES: alpha/beta hydrolase [Vibrio]|uniref:Alpha/beta fold hydrolase n=1 Tax=Vibrio algicola TaxID=2662262 RepID=A0A5Q0TIU4_9VIBR|nr:MULTISPECIES: alpha/beta fold hydrolase [Vibrio]MBD1577659.1 alpha/beta fold hydrolase [Vibrio sp. S11_S32]